MQLFFVSARLVISDRVFLSKSEGFRTALDPSQRVFPRKSEGFRFVSDSSHINLNALPNLKKGFQIFRSDGKLKILKSETEI